jgi:hypothetical protein
LPRRHIVDPYRHPRIVKANLRILRIKRGFRKDHQA